MVVVHSATKGFAAMTLALAHSRGWFDYEERVCTYWPEFAQQGKERITVRQLLAHQAGLFAINEPVDRSIVADLDRLAAVLGRPKPASHRRLAWTCHLRLPDTIPNSRTRIHRAPGRMQMLFGFRLRLTLDAINPRSNIYRALVVNPGTEVYMGRELGLRKETPDFPATHGFNDECLRGEVHFSRRRRVRVRGSDGGCRLRVRDKPNANDDERRPARCGAQIGVVSRDSRFFGRVAGSGVSVRPLPVPRRESACHLHLGIAWVMMWVALAIHITDEALTGFLSVYNPTVLALRAKLPLFPMPTFEFREWLTGLSMGIFLLALLSPFAFRNARLIRPLFYFVAIVAGIFNALGHTAATILGQTVSTVHLSRPAPGFYSSPFLFAAAIYAVMQLRRTAVRVV